MKIVCISDTHISDRYEALPPVLLKELSRVDLIIHAGDFTSLEFYEKLKTIKPLRAALGNLDALELRAHLKEKETFTVNKFKVGIMHGFGRPDSVLENVKKSFDQSYDLIVFGHTHNTLNEKIGKTIFLNPGSPTDKIFSACNSYALIEIEDTINVKIIKI
jgi:putative phosphoesterase